MICNSTKNIDINILLKNFTRDSNQKSPQNLEHRWWSTTASHYVDAERKATGKKRDLPASGTLTDNRD